MVIQVHPALAKRTPSSTELAPKNYPRRHYKQLTQVDVIKAQLERKQFTVKLTVIDTLAAAIKRRKDGVEGTCDLHASPKLSNGSAFLNMLHGHVNPWIKAIQGVTKLTRDVTSGLRNTVAFITDTGLKDATDLVHKYNQLMKGLPLNDLLSATDLDRVHESLGVIFGHINRKLKLSPYPIRRALPLVEAISRDFNDVLLRILTSFRLAYTPYETFDRLLVQASTIFRSWDDLTNVAREVQRKRSERFIPIKIVPAHGKLQERVRYLREWRKQHEQLAVMTGPSKGLNLGSGTGVGMEEEVKEAYEVAKRVDVLDVSVEGTEIWVAAENAYNERVSRVENQIISRLRDRLGTARDANEMFRVFSKFNALFVRPKIRGAIQEYQTQLIDSVKENIKHLHDKFKTQYRYSESYHMSQMRDLPPIAGAADQTIASYLSEAGRRCLEQGLGAEQRLQRESTAFRKKLDIRPVFDAWLFDINRRNMGVEGRLFEVVRLRSQASSSSAQFHLAVNFDPQVITLFKEVRIMLWLGFAVPHAIVNMAKDAKRVYPHAVSLMESVRTYGQILEMVERNKDIEPLVDEWRSEAQAMVTRGMSIRWDHFVNQYDTGQHHANSEGRDNRHVQFVREFASVVSVLQVC
ncbi:dynein heavy chain, N-terminal region 1-domain-containing protein [Mycena floridula]|nr:dynein heavy chain, N-terminal region 1-domain-containing protein [Mycena floridula]KAJ7575275.1 dynein heavy chain, N-terminal region 1-domain-containing protein [Mycena floridula]